MEANSEKNCALLVIDKVVTDAVAGSSPRAHEYALEAIKYLQRDALITTSEIEKTFSC